MHELYFGKIAEKDRVALKGAALKQVTEILIRKKYLKKNGNFIHAFNEFIGNENFEERADPSAGWVDKPVLDHIFNKFENQ